MTTALSGAPRRELRAGPRPHASTLLWHQLLYTLQELWRSRVVFIFTFLFPLTWLVVLGSLVGNATVDDGSGVRVMQFVAPTAAAMGVTYAAFPTVAITLALARESGVLKRVHGTPLPPWVYLAGRVGGAVVFALGSVLIMLTVGVLAYDVQIVWATALASLTTIAVAIACFASLGLAVACVSPSATFAQAASIGSAVVVTFLSGMYSEGAQAPWADRIAAVLPLKPFDDALGNQFDPLSNAAGWDLGALAVMAAWTVGALVVAVRAFGWDAQRAGRRTRGDAAPLHQAVGGAPSPAVAAARPTAASVFLQQIRHTTVAAWRDPGWVFFAVALPVGLFSYNMANYGDSGITLHGASYVVAFAAGMITWGAAVTAFVNMPEAIAHARDEHVLKRLRGTPLAPSQYIIGRVVSALWIALLTGALVVAVGVTFFGLRPDWVAVPAAVGVLLLGTATMAACGIALSSVLPSSKAVSAVALGLLLPLSFFSDIFVIVGLPPWMATVGSLLPLKHIANLLTTLMEPGLTTSWSGVAVLVLWLVGTGWLAVRTFRWDRPA
jgi:ABC-type multidrug transport system permease subunit